MTEALATYDNSKIDLIKKTVAKDATDTELQLFLYQAQRTGLDPLSKQIHAIKRSDSMTIQTGIDGYRLIADRTGKYAGNDDPKFGPLERGNPQTATVTVWKMVDDQKCAFTATARWKEYYPGDKQGFMWKKLPFLMLGKCAEALALRKAFPAELSGIYTHEEMQQADTPPINSPASPKREESPPPQQDKAKPSAPKQTASDDILSEPAPKEEWLAWWDEVEKHAKLVNKTNKQVVTEALGKFVLSNKWTNGNIEQIRAYLQECS